MMKRSILLLALCLTFGASFGQNKLDQDREAIKALAGYYKVTFNYAETFAPSDDYKFHERHRSSANEWAVILEDSPKKIVIQHLLVMRGDSMIIKHWREDWTYEDPEILVFDKDDTWKKVIQTPEAIKGKWTQKVYQVDDSPRYQAIGTWVHVDGKHQWQSKADSPLPRREYTERSDYNVLNRGNTLYLTPTGWMFEQDNKKINRTPQGDEYIAMEKGLEEFIRIDPARFGYAKKWWAEREKFWTDTRAIWAEVFKEKQQLRLAPKVNNQLLYEGFFEMVEKSVKEKWSTEKNKTEVRNHINKFLI